MFATEQFIEACLEASRERSPQLAVKEILDKTVREPGEVEHALGTPTEAGVQVLYRSDDLTIVNAIWAPLMSIYPHDHRIWAVIGIYGGQEDNAFYRRRQDGQGLDEVNSRSISEKDVVSLGPDVIHAVANPQRKFTGAIHVYGGDFFTVERSEWDSPSAQEQPYSVERTLRTFAEANERAKELLSQER